MQKSLYTNIFLALAIVVPLYGCDNNQCTVTNTKPGYCNRFYNYIMKPRLSNDQIEELSYYSWIPGGIVMVLNYVGLGGGLKGYGIGAGAGFATTLALLKYLSINSKCSIIALINDLVNEYNRVQSFFVDNLRERIELLADNANMVNTELNKLNALQTRLDGIKKDIEKVIIEADMVFGLLHPKLNSIDPESTASLREKIRTIKNSIEDVKKEFVPLYRKYKIASRI